MKRQSTAYLVLLLCLLTFRSLIYSQQDSLNRTDQKSPETAQLLSALGTVVPIAAGFVQMRVMKGDDALYGWIPIAFGVIVGPSVGYVYSDELRDGASGVIIRTGILSGVVVITWTIGRATGLGGIGLVYGTPVVGLLVAFIHSVYDIGHVGDVLREKNESAKKVRMSLFPYYSGSTGSAGIGFQLEF